MTIIELRNKRAQKLAAAKAFLEAKRNADGFLSEEDDATYTKLETEITNLGNEIARMERLEALDNELLPERKEEIEIIKLEKRT